MVAARQRDEFGARDRSGQPEPCAVRDGAIFLTVDDLKEQPSDSVWMQARPPDRHGPAAARPQQAQLRRAECLDESIEDRDVVVQVRGRLRVATQATAGSVVQHDFGEGPEAPEKFSEELVLPLPFEMPDPPRRADEERTVSVAT